MEVEITNPTHPLFGQRFELIWAGNPAFEEAHAIVRYGEYMQLKIPLSATNLGVPPFSLSTKLSLESIQAIIKLFKDSEDLCHINLGKSSKTCRASFNKKSGKKS